MDETAPKEEVVAGEKTEAVGPGRKVQLIELLVFLSLIVPSMILSFFAVSRSDLSFPLVAVATILRDLSLVALIFFFLWRGGESLDRIGWKMPNEWGEFTLGVVLFVPFTLGMGLIEGTLRKAGLSAPPSEIPFLTPHGPAQLLLASVLTVVIAVTEEIIFRGYLLLRFRGVTSSPVASVLFSSIIFSIGHGYEGTAGIVTVAVMGVVLAIVYLRRGSLVAPIVMHFLQDFIGLVFFPLLGS
jgi:membrane protease YdiL (CAAX protease family)